MSEDVKIGIIMGSNSDWPTMQAAARILDDFGVPYEARVVSAHRTPDLMFEYAEAARGRGLKAIIAGAGGAAHLPGMVAAKTTLPVLGVPVQSRALSGQDSLLSIVQMPKGVPVATFAIGEAGAANAALFAVSLMANEDAALADKLTAFRQKQTETVLAMALSPVEQGLRLRMNTIDAILPPATLGMLGGGQLGRFFVHAAHEMGYQVWVLDPDANSPAGRAADRHILAEYEDFAALDLMAEACAGVTTEFENVPAGTLDYLAKFIPVRPGAAAVSVCQNRIVEKTFLADNGLPHGAFRALRSVDDLTDLPDDLFPAILKVARFGYDGKGQVTVHDAAQALHAFNEFGGEACVLEKRLALDSEVSVVLAREASGSVTVFPVAENQHRHGILDVSITPARVDAALATQARQLAEHIATRLGYVGTLAVEFFISGGALYVNEMAPRPHNSGHATIDANITDQYMQQVRALCGLPLGVPRAHSAAVMVNLLGDLWYRAGDERAHEPNWAVLHAVPNLRLHLYGKHHARAGRKMGHFTVVDTDVEAALAAAMAARSAIGITDD